jgi:hypothetical protein
MRGNCFLISLSHRDKIELNAHGVLIILFATQACSTRVETFTSGVY